MRSHTVAFSLALALCCPFHLHTLAAPAQQGALVKKQEGVLKAPSPCEKGEAGSCYEEKIADLKEASENDAVIGLYRPKYIMPVFYTLSPYHARYEGHVPNGQALKQREVKGQVSFQVPVVETIAGLPVDLVGAYTQSFFWQLYAESAYFRETNYEPEIFLRSKVDGWGFVNLGINHQSNGKGGLLERSWNRLYLDIQFASSNIFVSVKPWLVIFASESSNLYNPDISQYLGNGMVVLAMKKNDFIVSLMLRNQLESKFARGSHELSLSFPKMKRFRFYLQAFQGYGHSLIEYDHFTSGLGLGLAVNDWL